MKALLVGGAGFIGGWLANLLADKGHEVYIVDNFERAVSDDFLSELVQTKKINVVNIDASELQSSTLPQDFDLIYHLAALLGVDNVRMRPYDVLSVNYSLLENVIRFAKDQKSLQRFVFFSTSEVYAGTLDAFSLNFPTPENTPLTIARLDEPRTSYMLSKIYGEALTRFSGLPCTIVRPHNFYGPRMGLSHVIPQLLEKFWNSLDGESVDVYSLDHQRTFCYIEEAVEIIYELSTLPNGLDGSFNVGTQNPEITMGELARRLMTLTERDVTVNALPATPGSPARRQPDTTAARIVASNVQPISLDDGLRKTFDWYRSNVFQGNRLSAI